MVYHGDSTLHENGKTTEAITIEEIGLVDYLFFLNREAGDDDEVNNEVDYLNQ